MTVTTRPPNHTQATRRPSHRHEPETTWIDALPFRALLRQLMSDTRLPAPVLAIAIGIPPRTALALVSTSRPPRRIRWVDAHAMFERDYWQLTIDAHRTTDATAARQALRAICPQITPHQLSRLLCTDEWIATGLLEGWLTTCEQVVVWRALALADGWTNAADFGSDAASAPMTPAT